MIETAPRQMITQGLNFETGMPRVSQPPSHQFAAWAIQLRSLLGSVERRRSEYIVVIPEKQLLRLNLHPFFLYSLLFFCFTVCQFVLSVRLHTGLR